MRIIWTITALTLFTASCFFSIQLLTELADDTATTAAYTAVAVALALVQYAILPRSIRQYQNGQLFSSLTGFTTWALLTLLSIAASAGALIGDTERQNQNAITSSTEYQLLLSQIKQLQSQSAQLQSTAKLDSENGYRSRAVKTLDKNTVIQNNIKDLRQKLSQLKPEQTTAATGLFTRIADKTGYTADTVMTFIYMAVAILIELALTVSVTALAEQPAEKQHQAPKDNAQHRSTESAPVQPVTLQARITQWLPGGQPTTSCA